MAEYIPVIISFLIAAVFWVFSSLSFQEKGFLFNNAYIYASRAEREHMNKKPYYRQSAVVFLLLGITFALIGLESLLDAPWFFYIAVVLMGIVVVYAICSSISILKGEKS